MRGSCASALTTHMRTSSRICAGATGCASVWTRSKPKIRLKMSLPKRRADQHLDALGELELAGDQCEIGWPSSARCQREVAVGEHAGCGRTGRPARGRRASPADASAARAAPYCSSASCARCWLRVRHGSAPIGSRSTVLVLASATLQLALRIAGVGRQAAARCPGAPVRRRPRAMVD